VGESPDTYCCAFAAVAVRSHYFQRCKGKSQLSNDLGIRYGLSKIFLSLRVKEYLAESMPQLPTVYRHRQPSESIVKSKVPNGKEQKAPNQEGKS